MLDLELHSLPEARYLYIILFFQELTAIPSRKKECLRLVCQKREFAVRSSSYEVSRCEVSEVRA